MFRTSRLRRAGLCLTLLMFAGCTRAGEYPRRPITLVCPWAAGGGTDRCSRQIAAHLEQELGVPVSVINATGGKGVTGHSRGLHARPDGYTLQMATLELNMLHWSGLTELTYRDCIPLMSINEDYAALFVRKDAPWQNVSDLEAAIAERPMALKASGTASGGAWHLALAGWLLAANLAADDVVWISSTGANPSLLELISGGVDMVCCSLPEAAALYEAGEVRALGVMAPQPVPGYAEVPTFAGQGRDWSLGGWRGIVVPLGTPAEVVDRLMIALTRIVTGQTAVVSRRSGDGDEPTRQTFPQFMDAAGFDRTWRPGAQFGDFMAETDEKFGVLLTSDAMRSVNRDRYNAMTWPRVLIAAAGVLLVLMVARSISGTGDEPRIFGSPADGPGTDGADASASRTTANWRNFAVIVGTIALYMMLAETVGFLLLATVLLFAMLWWLGTRLWVSAVATLIFVPLAWQVFSGVLRVPLPHGWWEWR